MTLVANNLFPFELQKLPIDLLPKIMLYLDNPYSIIFSKAINTNVFKKENQKLLSVDEIVCQKLHSKTFEYVKKSEMGCKEIYREMQTNFFFERAYLKMQNQPIVFGHYARLLPYYHDFARAYSAIQVGEIIIDWETKCVTWHSAETDIILDDLFEEDEPVSLIKIIRILPLAEVITKALESQTE